MYGFPLQAGVLEASVRTQTGVIAWTAQGRKKYKILITGTRTRPVGKDKANSINLSS